MKTSVFKQYIWQLFNLPAEQDYDDENFGFNNYLEKEIKTIGFAVNLNEEVIKLAQSAKVDLILTHHNVWDYLGELKPYCLDELKKHNLIHLFIHLPLDDIEFGTNATIFEKLGITPDPKPKSETGYYTRRIGSIPQPMALIDFVPYLEKIFEQPVDFWNFSGQPVKKIGLVAGGGEWTANVEDMRKQGVDTYITGETNLFTLETARFYGINIIDCTHTMSEYPGIKSLADRIKNDQSQLNIVRLNEKNIEVPDNR